MKILLLNKYKKANYTKIILRFGAHFILLSGNNPARDYLPSNTVKHRILKPKYTKLYETILNHT